MNKMGCAAHVDSKITGIIRSMGYTPDEVVTTCTGTYVHIWGMRALKTRQSGARVLWSIRSEILERFPNVTVVTDSIGMAVVSVVVDPLEHAEYERGRARRRLAEARVARTITERTIRSYVGRGVPLLFSTHPATGEVVAHVESADEARIRRALRQVGVIGRPGSRDRVVVSSDPNTPPRSEAQRRYDHLVEAGVVGERLPLPAAS